MSCGCDADVVQVWMRAIPQVQRRESKRASLSEQGVSDARGNVHDGKWQMGKHRWQTAPDKEAISQLSDAALPNLYGLSETHSPQVDWTIQGLLNAQSQAVRMVWRCCVRSDLSDQGDI